MAHVSAESHISASFVKRLYAKHNLALIKKFIKKGIVLEIGAGAGYFLDEARKESFEVYGIELNSIQAEFLRNKLGIPCEESPLGIPLFGRKRFDIIYHCDVISHFYDPISEFYKINDMLNKNGFVVFETGNLGDVNNGYYKHFTRFQYPDHLFFFSENNLRELLKKTGFEFIKIYRYSILPQLILTKKLTHLIRLLQPDVKTEHKNKHNVTEVSISVTSKENTNRFHLRQFVKKACNYAFNVTLNYLTDYFSYFARYKIGYIVPKKGRPQTVIVIARKKN
jgi:2-polyprenyl-3-methyl-5-hydroxy-6-metoxy-1,4-benzoquinol methylase